MINTIYDAGGALARHIVPGGTSCKVGAALLLAAGVVAYTGGAQAQSLSEVVSTALEAHPLVAANKASLKAAEHGIDQERGGLLPSLNLSADTGYQNAERTDSSSVTEDLWRNKQRLSLSQLLYDGSETYSRYEAAQATADAVRYEVRSAALQIAERAVNAYLNAARDRELVDFAVQNINIHQAILADVEEAARTGGGSSVRVTQVRTRLLNAQSQRRRLEGDLRNSIADFVEAVGQVPENLSRPALPSGDLPDSFEAAVEVALGNNPDLLSSRERERAAELTADAARGSYFPTIDVEMAHERRDNTDGTRGVEKDSTVLLRMTWELYAGGADTAARRRALEQQSETLFRTREVDRLLREDLATAFNNYETARDRVALLRERLGTAAEVRDAYSQQFRLGQISILDLVDSSNELFVAQTDLATTEYNLLRAAFDILAADGTLLSTLGVAFDADKAVDASMVTPVK